MQYILVKGEIIEVILMQFSYSIEFNVFGWKVRYKSQCLSEGSIYDCIYTASWGYYLRAVTVKTVAINW